MLSPLLEVEAELGPADSAIETDEPRATTPGADEQRPGPAEGWTEANANTTTKALARCGAGYRASPPINPQRPRLTGCCSPLSFPWEAAILCSTSRL